MRDINRLTTQMEVGLSTPMGRSAPTVLCGRSVIPNHMVYICLVSLHFATVGGLLMGKMEHRLSIDNSYLMVDQRQ